MLAAPNHHVRRHLSAGRQVHPLDSTARHGVVGDGDHGIVGAMHLDFDIHATFDGINNSVLTAGVRQLDTTFAVASQGDASIEETRGGVVGIQARGGGRRRSETRPGGEQERNRHNPAPDLPSTCHVIAPLPGTPGPGATDYRDRDVTPTIELKSPGPVYSCCLTNGQD